MWGDSGWRGKTEMRKPKTCKVKYRDAADRGRARLVRGGPGRAWDRDCTYSHFSLSLGLAFVRPPSHNHYHRKVSLNHRAGAAFEWYRREESGEPETRPRSYRNRMACRNGYPNGRWAVRTSGALAAPRSVRAQAAWSLKLLRSLSASARSSLSASRKYSARPCALMPPAVAWKVLNR